jgi:hypothetical protein
MHILHVSSTWHWISVPCCYQEFTQKHTFIHGACQSKQVRRKQQITQPSTCKRKCPQYFLIPTDCRNSKVEIISWLPHLEEISAGSFTKWYWNSIPFMKYHCSIFQRKLTWGASISCVFSYIQNTDGQVWCCNGQSEIDTVWKEEQKAKTRAKISRSKKIVPYYTTKKASFLRLLFLIQHVRTWGTYRKQARPRQ